MVQMNEWDEERFVELLFMMRKIGGSYRTVAKVFGWSTSTMRRFLVAEQTIRGERLTSNRRLDERRAAVRASWDKGMSLRETAALLHVGKSTVQRDLRALGIATAERDEADEDDDSTK